MHVPIRGFGSLGECRQVAPGRYDCAPTAAEIAALGFEMCDPLDSSCVARNDARQGRYIEIAQANMAQLNQTPIEIQPGESVGAAGQRFRSMYERGEIGSSFTPGQRVAYNVTAPVNVAVPPPPPRAALPAPPPPPANPGLIPAAQPGGTPGGSAAPAASGGERSPTAPDGGGGGGGRGFLPFGQGEAGWNNWMLWGALGLGAFLLVKGK